MIQLSSSHLSLPYFNTVPHVVWLINGKKVISDSWIIFFVSRDEQKLLFSYIFFGESRAKEKISFNMTDKWHKK